MTRVALALGSNLGDRHGHLDRACAALEVCGVHLERLSSVIETDPLGPPQPRYLNQVVIGDTDLDAHELLQRIQTVELELGRERGAERWGPRVIDIDILALGTERVSDESLTIPHGELHRRRFVLEPWAEVDPEFVIAGYEATVRQLLEDLER